LKLQKQLSRKAEGKEYAKWVIVVPPSKVEELGWKEGQELMERVNGNKLVLMPKEKQKIKFSKNAT